MQRTEVLVPLKAFSEAKSRLRPALLLQDRVLLMKKMAVRVIAAAGRAPVYIVSAAPDVVTWATENGINCLEFPHSNLNQAMQQAMNSRTAHGVDRIVVAHGDLPRAKSFDDYTQVDGTVLVPDRAGRGTNVLSLPTERGFTFHYGAKSAPAHYQEAVDRNWPISVVKDIRLSLDIDTLTDLAQLRAEDPKTYQQLVDGSTSADTINQIIDREATYYDDCPEPTHARSYHTPQPHQEPGHPRTGVGHRRSSRRY